VRCAYLDIKAVRVEFLVTVDEAQQWPNGRKHTLAYMIAVSKLIKVNTTVHMTAKEVLLPWKFFSLKENSINTLTCQGRCSVRACRTAANDENSAFLGRLRFHSYGLTIIKALSPQGGMEFERAPHQL
jgi:hypothetical protein